ncbi:MAG: class I SAM-dependent methyltransferase [Pseudomonadota bacterium]
MNLTTALKDLAKTAGDPVFWPASRSEIRSLLKTYPAPRSADVWKITQQYAGQGWYKRLGAYQVESEFRGLIDWAASVQPAVVIEIGTANGATLLMWSRVATQHIISIDLPGGIHGGGYPAKKGKLFREFLSDRERVRLDLLRRDSQRPETKAEVLGLLGGRQADILFIDGDHRLEGVTRDFELWKDIVRPGGFIVFHDVVPHREATSQVDVLWRQIKAAHPDSTREIVQAQDQGWAGIGILQV